MSDTSQPSPTAAGPARTTIFADAVTDAVVAHGVARLSLAMTGPDGKPSAVGTLCVPVMQLPSLVNGLGNLIQQLQAKAREVQQQQAKPVQATTEPNTGAADAAFRFNP